MLKNFQIDYNRACLIPDVEFYQMDLAPIVQLAKHDPMFQNLGPDELPSWTKYVTDPRFGKGFFVSMLESVFLGKHAPYSNSLNVDIQFTNRPSEKPRVAMMFLSGSTGIENGALAMIVEHAKQALPGFVVVDVSGNTMSNADAEQIVKRVVKQAKKDGQDVLLLSAGMAQRSFSIPEITELYLAYDGGSNGATIQKMSRTLTPKDLDKVGRIVSLSFDPNRDDKFDALILTTALNYQKNKGIKSSKHAFRAVLDTIDIFSCQPRGSVKIDPDTYLESLLARKSVSRVAGKIADIFLLSDDEIKALAKGNAEYLRSAGVEGAEKGKTSPIKSPKKAKGKGQTNRKPTDAAIQKAREVIVTIIENLDIIVYGAKNATTIEEALAEIEQDAGGMEFIKEEFGVDLFIIKGLFKRGVINLNVAQLLYDM